jgi:hypothetical protein
MKTIKLADIKLSEVEQAMKQQQPDWMIRWADSQDLRDSLDIGEIYRKEFLTQRARDKIALVLRATYVAQKRLEKEAAENSANLAKEAGL